MDPVTIGVVAVALSGAAIFWAVRLAQRRIARRNAMMERVAGSIEGTAFPGKASGLRPAHPRVAGKLDGVEVEAEIWDVKNGTIAEWRARVPHAAMPRFRVYKEWLGSSVGKALGMQDVEVGHHAEFNRHFIVRSAAPALMRHIWSSRSMDVVVRRFPKANVECDGGSVTLRVYEDIESADTVEVGLRLVATLAGADIFGLAALRQMEGAQDIGRIDGFPSVRIAGPCDVVAGAVEAMNGIVTRVRAPSSDDTRDAVVHVRKGQVSGDARLTAEQRRLAEALGTANVEWAHREVSVTWKDVETRVPALEAAVSLVRSLVSAPKQGVFR